MRGRTSHYTPLEFKHFKHNDPQSGSLTQFETSLNVISKSRPRGVGGTRKKAFGKSVVEKQELRRANRGGKRSGRNNKKNLELEVEDMEVTVKKNNLTQHQNHTFDSELLSENENSPEKKELDIDDTKMNVDEDSDATQPLDTQPNDGAEFHFDEEDEVGKNDAYNRNGGIDEDEDDTDVDSDVDDNVSVESELGSRCLFPKSTVKKNKNNNRKVIKDEESDDEEDDVDMDVVDTTKKQKKKTSKGKSTTTKKNTNSRKKTSTKKHDDTSDEETDYEGGKENSTKRGVNTTDTTSGKRRSERLKSNKPINLDESRFSDEDSERELDSDDEDITYSSRRVKGDKKRGGGGKSSKHGKLLCSSVCCLGIPCLNLSPLSFINHIPSIKQASLNTWRKTLQMMRSPRAAARSVNPQLVAPPSGETNPTCQKVSSFIAEASI